MRHLRHVRRAPPAGFVGQPLGHLQDETFPQSTGRGWISASEIPGLKSVLIVKVPPRITALKYRNFYRMRQFHRHLHRFQCGRHQRYTDNAISDFKQRRVGALKDTHQRALAMMETLEVWKHVVRHHRGQGDGDSKAGGENRDNVGLTERRKQRPSIPDNAKRGTNTRTMIARWRLRSGASWDADTTTSNAGARSVRRCPIFAQAPEDVLNIDHGVIDQFAEARRATKGRRVDGQAGKIRTPPQSGAGSIPGRSQRDQPSCASSSGRETAPMATTAPGFKQDTLYIADRGLDEIGLDGNIWSAFIPVGRDAVDFLEGLFDLARHRDSQHWAASASRERDDSGFAHIAGVAALDLVLDTQQWQPALYRPARQFGLHHRPRYAGRPD